MSIPRDQYAIRRHPKGGFIWTPSEDSRELRDALALKYPEIIGHRAKMQEALNEFLRREKRIRPQTRSLGTAHSDSAHDSSSQHNPSDSSLGQKKIRGRRKGPLSDEGRKHFQENYGKACKQHRESKTKASFTKDHF